MKRFFALTTLFSIYIFPASVKATITPIQLNYETVGIPKEETKSFSKDNNSDLISKKSAKNDDKKKVNSFIKFLGLLVLSYALVEILDSDSSSSTTSTTTTTTSTSSTTKIAVFEAF
tara:strand:+ start:247 stop:597 length:351 start_codon:yes stop_codon:yes gene_type:complete